MREKEDGRVSAKHLDKKESRIFKREKVRRRKRERKRKRNRGSKRFNEESVRERLSFCKKRRKSEHQTKRAMFCRRLDEKGERRWRENDGESLRETTTEYEGEAR